jgi:hypothetical protein
MDSFSRSIYIDNTNSRIHFKRMLFSGRSLSSAFALIRAPALKNSHHPGFNRPQKATKTTLYHSLEIRMGNRQTFCFLCRNSEIQLQSDSTEFGRNGQENDRLNFLCGLIRRLEGGGRILFVGAIVRTIVSVSSALPQAQVKRSK